MNAKTIGRVLLFLNAHQDELLELGAAVAQDEEQQSNRFDRRVLTERFLMAMVQGAATRVPLDRDHLDRLVQSARALTDLFLADLRHADELAERPINVAGVAPAQS